MYIHAKSQKKILILQQSRNFCWTYSLLSKDIALQANLETCKANWCFPYLDWGKKWRDKVELKDTVTWSKSETHSRRWKEVENVHESFCEPQKELVLYKTSQTYGFKFKFQYDAHFQIELDGS